MEQEDRGGEVGEDQGLASFNISEAELISLQQAGGLVGAGAPDSTDHLSQGDLEALASIQEELDRMASGQSNIISEEIVMGAGSGLGPVLGEAGDQVLVQAAFDRGLDLATFGTAEARILSPSLAGSRQASSKVRVGEVSSQQLRLATSQGFSLAGQQVRLVNTGNNLKSIAPSEPNFLNLKAQEPGGSIGNISIINQDGSLTTLPVGGPGIRIVSAGGQQQVQRQVRSQHNIQPQPQHIRIMPSQSTQSFKISLSDVSRSFIRPFSLTSTLSSPRKKTVSYSSLQLKSPQKVITLKPPEGTQGQIIRTADGRLISLQGAAKKVVLPVFSTNTVPLHHTFSPTKIVIRDSQGNSVQTVAAGQARNVSQVLRLDQAR